jgi:hypothetical protein
MSFGPTAAEKAATTAQQGIANTAVQNAGTLTGLGGANVAAGASALTPATDFFKTLLSGNQANTAAMMAPDINRMRAANQNALQSTSTLMPRGGGREGTLFNASFAPTAQAQSMFNTVRGQAAPALANIGLGEQSVGANLFGIGNQALQTGSTTQANLEQQAQLQQQLQNALWGQLGGGLFSLATTPFGGGTAANGLLGLIGSH